MTVPPGLTLRAGDRIAVTDDEADTVAAVVLADPVGNRVEVRILWEVVLARAEEPSQRTEERGETP